MPQVTPSSLGPYFGSNLGFKNYEILTVAHIPKELRKIEPGLMKTKWFDYRSLHPMGAMYLFGSYYATAYQEFYRVAIDAECAPFVRPTKSIDLITTREKLSFWRLRQVVDTLGMPYDFFMSRAMKWYAEQCFRQNAIYAPRPQHISTNEELLADVTVDWEEELEIRLQIPKSSRFRSENFAGHEDQLAYEDFIVGQIQSRHHPVYALKAALYQHEVLRIERAILDFDARTVTEAIAQVCEE
ncbi:hypothetical protein [Ferrovum sp.]|uniref:hypothetical protein n=1 Tax=Ferrovum sp. TaxID=2609467 RepID=UPI00262F4142|nr:hypothetical protein [Ferrovum sp.]